MVKDYGRLAGRETGVVRRKCPTDETGVDVLLRGEADVTPATYDPDTPENRKHVHRKGAHTGGISDQPWVLSIGMEKQVSAHVQDTTDSFTIEGLTTSTALWNFGKAEVFGR